MSKQINKITATVFPFRKEIQRILFGIGLLFLVATGFYVAEIFYPGFERNSVPYIGFAFLPWWKAWSSSC